MAKEKKIDIKKVKKGETVETVRSLFEDKGLLVLNGKECGMTDTTLVVRFQECDIQIKIVAPSGKNGIRYPKIEE